jgi:DNA-binding NtrC family response regulator
MKILIADDDEKMRKVLKTELSEEGFEVDEAGSGTEALEVLEKDGYDVLVLDLNMPGLKGMEVLRKIKSLELSTEVIVLTGHGTVPTAVEAMKLGAYDYLTKPFKLVELKAIAEKAYEKKALVDENVVLKTQIKRQSQTQRIITQNARMLEILDHIKLVGMSDYPILVHGESGVGKELIARAIHDSSKWAPGPFIPINCGAIHESLLESELFGHEKGSFTGAHAKKLGLAEIAHRGTLFLDEITELSQNLQGKLLRAIETGSFFRVGGIKEIRVEVRFVSATNKDIKSEMERGNLRSDLYFRISTVTVHIPPLRERKEDIPLLVEHTIKSNPAFKDKRFNKEALNVLYEYPWPGNVRELQNVVHRTLLLSKNNPVEPRDLPSDLTPNPKRTGMRLEEVEREHILKVLTEVGGRKGKAAEILGMDPKTLYRKLLEYETVK